MKRKVRAGLILMGVQLIIIFYLAFIRPTTNINTIIEMDYTSTSLLPPPLIDIDIFSLSTIQVITSITILNTLDINQRCSSQSLPKTFGRNEIRQIPIGSEKFLCDYGQLFFNPRENQNYSLLLDFNLFSQNYQSNFTCTVPIASRIPNNEPRKCKSEYIFTQYYDNDKIETIFQLKDYFQLPKIISQENFIEFLDISISFDVISMTKCPPFVFFLLFSLL